MFLIRPISMDDLDGLMSLASRASFGLTTLPRDRKVLSNRIEGSVHSFLKKRTSPSGENYLFILEDLDRGKIAGTTGIVSKVGGFEPFYCYQIKSVTHACKMLKVKKDIQALHLIEEHNGPTEIGTLFLNPDYRGRGVGRFLSLCRFLFMADFQKAFEKTVIAELRGVIDSRGRSPFWEAIGRHFFSVDFPIADRLSMKSKRFIAELMPRHPLYIPLLPQKVQKVLGEVHQATRPARAILKKEGFQFNQQVDIFEAGPTYSCELSKIRTVKQSKVIKITDISSKVPKSKPYLISNRQWNSRMVCEPIQKTSKGLIIREAIALALKVNVGDELRIVELP